MSLISSVTSTKAKSKQMAKGKGKAPSADAPMPYHMVWIHLKQPCHV